MLKSFSERPPLSPAMKLPSLTSPPAVINHMTRGMKSSGTTSISEHCYIYMTIQRDLPASRCHNHCTCLCMFLLSDADFASCIQVHIVVVLGYMFRVRQQWIIVLLVLCIWCLLGDYPAPRAVLTGHDQEVVCVSVCAELGLVISGAKG